MTRDAAARFSFLLSLPAVFAAGLYELAKERNDLFHTPEDAQNLLIATVVAAIVGYAAIALLIRFLKTHSTWVFIGYRLLLGVVLIVVVSINLLPNQPPPAEGRCRETAGSGIRRNRPRNPLASKVFPFFARTFPAVARLTHTGAETVSPPSVFLKWPVPEDEKEGIFR